MRLSVNVTNYSPPGGAGSLGAHLADVVRAAAQGDLDTVWVCDHLIQAAPGTSIDDEMLEAYTTLGYLAAQPAQVRLGAMVTPATYRVPSMLVKAVTTLDVLSGGRAWLGIGAGYHEEEAHAMGLPLPPVAERFERLEELLQVALRMWAGDESAHEGRHYRLERPVNSPRSTTRPHPPILIGGMGERRTLRLVAEYGDACNLFDIPDGGKTIAHKLSVLEAHCAELGRPYEEIEKTVSTRLNAGESAESFAERCGALAGLGIEHAVVIADGPWTDGALGTLASTVPLVRGL